MPPVRLNVGWAREAARAMAAFGAPVQLAVKVGLVAVAATAVTLLGAIWVVPQVDYNTRQGFVRHQPVPFSHKHHVGGLGLDCRYCHTGVEKTATAGIPPVETCMTCHSQLWTNAGVLAPVRAAYAGGPPLAWQRVNTLPDYVFFDHSIHVAKGVGCTECHGPIGDMPLVYKAKSLFMSWCLDCHRDPAPHLRPREAVFDPFWQRDGRTPTGAQLMAANHVTTAGLTECSTCHR